VISLLVGGLVALSACVALLGRRSARLSKEVDRQARVIAMMKLGHNDPEATTAGWRFKLVSGHIHAIPPEGGDGFFGLSLDHDPATHADSERCGHWTRPSGNDVSDAQRTRIMNAYYSWFRGRVIRGERTVGAVRNPGKP
jgi:hypothetical protein